MKKNKKIIIFFIIALIPIIIAILIASKFISAKSVVNKYLKSVYGENAKINSIDFNSYDMNYYVDCVIDNSDNGNDLASNAIYYYPSLFSHKSKTTSYILDENVSNFFDEQAKNDFQSVYESIGSEDLKIQPIDENAQFSRVRTLVVANNKYSKKFLDLETFQTFYLFITNFNDDISEKESQSKAAELSEQFVEKIKNEFGERYHFRSCWIIYNDKFGSYEIEVADDDLTFDVMINNIRKMNVGQEYIDSVFDNR